MGSRQSTTKDWGQEDLVNFNLIDQSLRKVLRKHVPGLTIPHLKIQTNLYTKI